MHRSGKYHFGKSHQLALFLFVTSIENNLLSLMSDKVLDSGVCVDMLTDVSGTCHCRFFDM
jgi:hypothetical protein